MVNRQGKPEDNVNKITIPQMAILRFLRRQYEFYKRNSKLSSDGSFYTTDENILSYIGGTIKTIKRNRKELQKRNLIKYVSGKHTGVATRYWLTEEGVRTTSFRLKGDIVSREGDKEGAREGQKYPPIIKESINKSTKHASLPKYYFMSVYEEKGKDIRNTKEALCIQGYTEKQIEDMMRACCLKYENAH